MKQRIEQLEIKVAFLEQANTQLGEEIFRVHQHLEALQSQLKALTGRFEAEVESPPPDPAGEEKPPHY